MASKVQANSSSSTVNCENCKASACACSSALLLVVLNVNTGGNLGRSTAAAGDKEVCEAWRR